MRGMQQDGRKAALTRWNAEVWGFTRLVDSSSHQEHSTLTNPSTKSIHCQEQNWGWISELQNFIWYTDYNSYNWEHEFMTIFVTWQSRVTLDSIRNSCDVLFLFFAFRKEKIGTAAFWNLSWLFSSRHVSGEVYEGFLWNWNQFYLPNQSWTRTSKRTYSASLKLNLTLRNEQA